MDFSNLTCFLDELTSKIAPGNDCVIFQNHKQIYRHTSGYSDVNTKKPVTGNELYYMWSTSKPITCAAALTLYEKGLFKLSDPLYEYLPEFKQMFVKETLPDGAENIRPAKNDITIFNLFTMTTGIPYNFDSPYIKEARQTPNFSTREIAKAIAKSPLEFDPGTNWLYGFSHDVLGAFIEVVSGMKLSDYAKKVIFNPLEMTDSTYRTAPKDEIYRMAKQYSYREDLGTVVSTNNTCGHKLGEDYDSGGAGVVSSASDYIKFADALANGGIGANGEKILNSSTIELMRKNAIGEPPLSGYDWKHLVGYGYGLGVRTLIDPTAANSKSSTGEFGWNGAAGSIAIIDPAKKLSVFYAQHMLNSQEERIFPKLRNIVYECLDK